MHFKALVSAIALGAAVSLSGPVVAQEINGVAIPEDELAIVQAHCDELAEDAENESLVTTTDDDDAGSEDDSGDAGDDSGDAGDDSGDADAGDDAAGGEGEPGDDTVSGTAEAVTTVIDLAQVDLQACVDAGFVEEPPM